MKTTKFVIEIDGDDHIDFAKLGLAFMFEEVVANALDRVHSEWIRVEIKEV